MEEMKTYTLDEAHLYFAKSINGRVWELLQKSNRTPEEQDEMLNAAHACAYHWKFSGSAVYQQRGEWLISRVHVTLDHPQEALRHAQRCFELTELHNDEMADFDLAYAHEGLARASALSGQLQEAIRNYRLAEEAAARIQDAEDRSIFMGDFQGGDWFGLVR